MSNAALKIVKLASYIDNSKKYARFKGFFKKILIYEHSKLKTYFDIFMIFLVISSVFFLIYDVRHPNNVLFEDFEVFALNVFIIEYIARVWVSSDSHKIVLELYEERATLDISLTIKDIILAILKKKLAYMSTPLAIIDLLAILPSYRQLRVLRIFLLLRLFKLFRYSKNIQAFGDVIFQKRFEIGTLGIFASFIVIASSSAIYMYEADINPKIDNFFHAIYWSIVTISTVGYGDITPKTTQGVIITLILIIAGVSVLAFLTSIIVSAFNEKLSELKENIIFSEVKKIHNFTIICGYGRVGENTAKLLQKNEESFVVIDLNEENIKQASSRGLKAIKGDATSSELMKNLGVGRNVNKVVCTADSDEINIFIALTARSLDKNVYIVSRVENRENKKKFLLAGVDYVFSPYEIVGFIGLQYISQPIAFEALNSMITGERGVEFDSIKILKKSFANLKRVDKLEFEKRRLILFGVLRKEEEAFGILYIKSYKIGDREFYFNPTDDFILKEDDIIIVFGRKYHIKKFKDEISLSSINV